VPVVRGATLGDLVAITGAVQAGEKTVQKPSADLKPGTPVKVAQK
jgi:hypothetical protein